MNDRKILAHLSISFGRSPVTGQKASVPNLFSAISLTLPPTLSETIVVFSIAILPHTPPFALSLDDHVEASGAAGVDDDEGAEGTVRRGGGSGVFLSMLDEYLRRYCFEREKYYITFQLR